MSDPGKYHRDRVEREKQDPEFRAAYEDARRQPSTRTAEPRTAAGRDLLATAYLAGDAASEGVSLLDAILAIEAEAADLRVPEEGEGLALAGLDVEALALVFAGITFSEWADAQGDTTRLFDLTRHVAAEYARLLRQRGERMTPEERLILRRAKAWAKAKRRHTAAWTAPNFDVIEHAQASRLLQRAEKLLLEVVSARSSPQG